MQLDLRTVSIKPLRNTFTHVARHIGGDKPATRYQEATFEVQAVRNFHYRPLWAPEFEIFDASRTKIVMKDWNELLDPRQFYYGSYTLARARMQEAAEADFSLVENRGLGDSMPDDVRQLGLSLFVPLRHAEWGGNTNSMFIAAYGYGAALTTPSTFKAMDHLGMAQYLTRLGLTLEDPSVLDSAKTAWLEDADWQELRRYIEDCFVIQDPIELYVAQNVALDGLLYPLFYGEIDARLASSGAGAVFTMLTRFQAEWFSETERWVNAVMKTIAKDSTDNKDLLETWIATYTARAREALRPLAARVFGDLTDDVLSELTAQLAARLKKQGLTPALEG